MKRIILLTLLLGFVTASASIRAEDRGSDSAAEVASWCEPYRTAILNGDHITVNSTPQSIVCWGAFMAIQQLISTTWSAQARESILRVCAPPETYLVELIKVYLHYTDQHPERGHEKFSDVALSALWQAFPCNVKGSSK
jgi:hypothetical protein